MNKTSIAILSFAILFIVSAAQEMMRAVEDRIISTYPFSDPNPIPNTY